MIYIGQRGDSLSDIPANHPAIDKVYSVWAGKFRRYHQAGLRQIFDAPTLLKNIRDFFFVAIGIYQSYRLIGKIHPDTVFIRGGFVGVPVGLASALRGVSYVTHDSDAMPSLTNRIISKWAVAHAVALSKRLYDYPQDKIYQVGVPIDKAYRRVSQGAKRQFRRLLNLKDNQPVLLVTGGGLGAFRLNQAIASLAPQLFARYPKLVILHISGRAKQTETQKMYESLLHPIQLKQVIIVGFVTNLYRYSGAADVIVCRGGATNLAEFAAQRKSCVVVPNPYLTGGHQLKNSQYLAAAGAIRSINEEDLQAGNEALFNVITELLDSPEAREKLAEAFGRFAQIDADTKLAELLLQVAKHENIEV